MIMNIMNMSLTQGGGSRGEVNADPNVIITKRGRVQKGSANITKYQVF